MGSRTSARLSRDATRRAFRCRRAFTLMETLVLIGIVVILLSIFVPYLQSIWESNRRNACANNLRIIRSALQNYARDNGWDFPRVRYDPETAPAGYTTFTGADDPNPFAADSNVQPNDVTASLWLLARIGYVDDLKTFVCPSAGGTPDTMTDARGQPVPPSQRSNFRSPANLSYSYALPFSTAPAYRLKPDFLPADFALLADQNPGEPAASQPHSAELKLLSEANSPNHGRVGQNVIYGDSSDAFQRTPYCGVGYKKPPGDNIFTARMIGPLTTQPATMPLSLIGVVGRQAAPIGNDDSYLVPTSTDKISDPLPRRAPSTTRAASAPATTTTTNTSNPPTTQ
jgi:type II secretory pathway pseudopilin PulG